MKNKLIYIFLLCFAVVSCDDTIEVKPKNFIAPVSVTSDITLLQSLVTSAYDRLQDFGYYGNGFTLLGDVMADNIYTDPLIPAGGGRYTQNNLNVAPSATTPGNHYNIWAVAYLAINDLNTVIANVDKSSATDAVKAATKGEAYGLRAMIYFDLARTYAYEPTKIQGGFNKGVVLRLAPTTDPVTGGPQQRATVDETYQSIESDFKQAISLLTVNTTTAGKFRMTKGTAYAMLGRTYLYWEKYPEAVTQFNLALDPANSGARLAPAGSYLNQFRTSSPASESFFELAFNNSTEITGVVGANSTLFSYTQPTGRLASTFGAQTPSDELVALFEPTDDRKALFYTYGPSSTASTPVFNWVSKYNGGVALYTDNVKILRYSDVLLMKAEALAEQTQYGAAGALVVQLRTNRNASVVGVPVDASIKDYIQTERRRELFFEGQRWFDLKRKGNGILKAAKTTVGSISPADKRILAAIPAAEVNNVPAGLPQNPGY